MKKIMSYFAICAIVLSMASCGDGNVPEVKVHKSKIEGCLDGLFSVSATEQVYFSKGNLQFQEYYLLDMQGGGEWIERWKFANDQYDIFGDKNSSIALHVLAPTDTRYIDLFGWGTGLAPTKHTTNNADYNYFGEWGNKPIFNGGNTYEQWRTLTKDEWLYLFQGRRDAAKLFGFGHIELSNGDLVKGVFLLPDIWDDAMRAEHNFHSAAEKGVEWLEGNFAYYSIPNDDDPYLYEHNEYKVTDKSWEKLEDAGAVFLPAAGYREDASVHKSWGYNECGWYWSSTPDNNDKSYFLYFSSTRLHPRRDNKYYGCSVRLVR